jgi:CubicO group peptidase (beta-lactamase class C family)
MDRPAAHGPRLSRRAILQATGSVALGAAATAALPGVTQAASRRRPATGLAASPSAQDAAALFRALDARIEAAMAEHHIPGVAVGVYYQGQEYVRGYGVTNVDYPQPVDGDTLFRIGSVTKTFTGTTAMRLVEQGLLDLDAPLRKYLPGLRLADESVAARVTLRQCLNHSAGWLGDCYTDFGRGADALTRYVANMAELPQLTPPGQVYAYNNAAIILAGHVIEAVAGQPYEEVVRAQVLDPLGLEHTAFFSDEIVGYNVAASHTVEAGRPVVTPAIWRLWRSLNPTGALIASTRDLLRYVRFHLSDGATAERPLLAPTTLRAMRAPLGPGGTQETELDGVGVTWFQLSTAEGVPVYKHTGDWPGQHCAVLFVPERDFALTLLTNATSGQPFRDELILGDDGPLRQFTGLSYLPAVPRPLPAAGLAAYEGRYWAQTIAPPPGESTDTWFEFSAGDGWLQGRMLAGEAALPLQLGFYRDHYARILDSSGEPVILRADFIPGPDGRPAWFRFGGRLHARQG